MKNIKGQVSTLIRYSLLLLFAGITSFAHADEIAVIREKYIQSVLYVNPFEEPLKKLLLKNPREAVLGDQMIVELMERYPMKESHIDNLINTLQSDGSWKDLDFNNQHNSGWPPKNHASRILDMAKVYANPAHAFYKSERVAAALHNALGYWFKIKPVANNWWYNEIGIPKIMGAAFVLFEDQLTPEEKTEAIRLMDKAKIGMTAQNKVWLAGNVLVKGLLLNDFELIRKARNAINEEIKLAYTNKEGIKVDHSFHQHGPQQQYGNYGAAYLATISFWAYILGDTSLALDQDRYKIMSDLANEGFRRILWKNNMDVNCLGRQFYVNVQRHKAASILLSVNALAQVDRTNRSAYQAIVDENTGQSAVGALGQYHFWKSDMTVHRRPQWMASVKMASNRSIGTEGGTENVKGYYAADGATYTYVDGKEYENIFPCWDWRKVPGVTCYQSDKVLPVLKWLEKQNIASFVGNVNDGSIGITAMDISRDGLSGRKAWVFTPDYVLCLGAAIATDSSYQVTTSVEQALLKDDLMYFNRGKWEKTTQVEFTAQNPQRFFHRNTGYIILDGKGKAFTEQRTYSWYEIMTLYPKDMLQTEDVFSIYIDHGMRPSGQASYQYVLLPATSKKQVQNFDTHSFKVISNTRTSQAVQLDKNTFLLALYEEGEISLAKGMQFSSSKPGLFILKTDQTGWEVWACDPTQKEDSLTITVNQTLKEIKLPDGEYKGTIARANHH